MNGKDMPPEKQQSHEGPPCSIGTLSKIVQTKFSGLYRRYGEFLATHPLPFIIVPLLVFGGLGSGLAFMDKETDLERVYFPKDSQAIQDRQTVRDLFPDLSREAYNAYSQSETELAATLLFKVKSRDNIFDPDVLSELEKHVKHLRDMNVTTAKGFTTLQDFCAVYFEQCVIDGGYVFNPIFIMTLLSGNVTYPYWLDLDLETAVGGVTLDGDALEGAKVLKISYKLARLDSDWLDQFLDYAANLELEHCDVTYEIPDSLDVELDKGTSGDVIWFSMTIALCCTYASIVTSGGNCVSSRGPLAHAGILAAGMGIVGSMGLMILCGLKFVNICGVIPFLVIGIGVDDMFLIMSSWSAHLLREEELAVINQKHRVPVIIGRTLGSAAIGITITSLTDFLAFAIGASSVFRCVTHFSVYAGVAILFCFIANITFFTACLALRGKCMYQNRHSYLCFVTKSPEELIETDHRSGCYARMCGGSIPKNPREDESKCEMLPRVLLPRLFRSKIACVVIVLLFVGYIGCAIYGVLNLRQGLELKNLVPEASYYHRHVQIKEEYFPTRVGVGFVVDRKLDYLGNDGEMYLKLLREAAKDPAVDPEFERCWLSAYQYSLYYNASDPENFIPNLLYFLEDIPELKPDIIIKGDDIVASRCYVYSKGSNDQYAMAELMDRMRKLAAKSDVPAFPYHWAFVAYEQFLAVLPATLQLIGIAAAVMTVVTFLFLPDLRMTWLVSINIAMILVGVFGFMHFWGLTLSSITMIHLVMSVGFSVDFSVHVCSAYLVSDRPTRAERAEDAITHAAGPILNGGMSTLVGVILLVFSKSYIFISFFRIMVLVIGFGMLHAVFFLPAVLSLTGPENARPQRPPPHKSQNGVGDQQTHF